MVSTQGAFLVPRMILSSGYVLVVPPGLEPET